ncbi:hypothetical protein [Methanobacterium sp. ACI-7]|uniref:hypothetical protein n=1 Tax=unclassified Methanobacterium TaxID=2627676 RepID=UPI0039C0FC50
MLFLSVIIAANALFSAEPDYNRTNIVNAQSKVHSGSLNESSEIKEAFYKIAKRKYDTKNYNCKHKSEAFAEFLTKKRAQNVQIATIVHESGKYSHMVVVWEGNVYDPTSTPPFYSMPAEKYFSMIKKYGFNGLRVTTPYTKRN